MTIQSKKPGEKGWHRVSSGMETIKQENDKLTRWQNVAQDVNSPFYGWEFRIEPVKVYSDHQWG